MHYRLALQRRRDALRRLLELIRIELLRDSQIDFHLAELRVEQIVVRLGDLADQTQAVLLVQDAEGVEQKRRQLAAKDAIQKLLALDNADGRVGQDLAESLVFIDDLPK